MSIIVYKDGSWLLVLGDHAWEYENDPDYLTSITLERISEARKQILSLL